ncbi:type IX secretion system protein PorD [Hymenobacter sp. PAMC 26628]|uniref:type IX secretion system protein PorD n=1 Tax=Hymenobacter sp. PAMC 26628 TaxID=1484118 RepID=UPI00076FEF17|nr:DUF4835 family protein [Hymenobacter sp. PAMC 26628]AMJ64837.1 hypothetical protein AXW84_04890 [Hymenobacter sp. PAMC 26628]
MRKIWALLPLLLLLLGAPARAQELNCTVEVSIGPSVVITDQSIVANMQRDISAFLNTRTWTSTTYQEKERIKCRMFVVITGGAAPSYQATMRLLSTRPIYGTGYETNVISIVDKSFNFNYPPPNSLDFSPNSFVSNLSSLLGFYANIIVGLDRDTFSRLGGTQYFENARLIMTYSASQSSSEGQDPSWTNGGGLRSRYQLLTNLTDPQLEAFRTGSYAYYRQGMDLFIEKPDEARTAVLGALTGINAAASLRVSEPIFRYFFDAKADEIANIFRTSSDPNQKQQLVTMLVNIDATNAAKYQAILTAR